MILTIETGDGRSVPVVVTKREDVESSYRIEVRGTFYTGLLYPLGIVSKSDSPKRKSAPWRHTAKASLAFATRREAIESLLRTRKVI